jgi:hypothetical protein
MRRGLIGVALLALALALAAAGAVQASRAPTDKERSLVAKVAKLPPQCAKVRISTVTKKPTWATATFKPGPTECDAHASNGDTIAMRKSGRWRFVTSGSDFPCSELYKKVPQEVVKDLHIFCF